MLAPFRFRDLARRARFLSSLLLASGAAACSSSSSPSTPDAGHAHDATSKDTGSTGKHDSGNGTKDAAGGTKDTGAGGHDSGRDTGVMVDTGVDAIVADAGDAGPASYPTDVLTQRGNNARSGIYGAETILTPANVSGIGKLFSMPVDGKVYAQPLYVTHYPMGSAGVRDVVIAATEANTVFAFDGDTGATLWQNHLGAPIPDNDIYPGYSDILVEVGVTSTPVVDRANGLIYVANKDLTGSDAAKVITHRLHVLDLATGKDVQGSPFPIVPSVPGSGDDAATLYFDPVVALQRPGLLLLNGLVYLAFGSHGDHGSYHGAMVAYQYDAAAGSLTQKYAWSTSPSVPARSAHAAIWQGGQGPTVGSDGNIYILTGNGASSSGPDGGNYADSFIKLSPKLELLDYFIPYEASQSWNGGDLDLGSGGPVLVPGTKYMVGAGKAGELFVVKTDDLGKTSSYNINIPQQFSIGSQYYGSPLAWNGEGATRIYVWAVGGYGGYPKGLPLTAYALDDAGVSFSSMKPIEADGGPIIPAQSYPGADAVGVLSLSCNGATDGTGIVWGVAPAANPNHAVVLGTLYAFDPVTLNVLWSSAESLGDYSLFVPPVVANGRVYIPGTARTDGGVVQQIQAYGLAH